ncbi:MAG: type 2 isopentenyl-diphosphate Delta-isomerase [Thermosphaera sp.]
MSSIYLRKLQHLEIVASKDVDFTGKCSEYFNDIILIHQAIPGFRIDEVDTRFPFLGYELKAPLMITGITGGAKETLEINRKLAQLAAQHGIALGLGSQRPILTSNFDQDVLKTYRVAREVAGSVPLIGNIGFNTLKTTSIQDIKHLIDAVGVDALAVHLNPAQEVIQPEGDTDFSDDIIYRLRDLVKEAGVPVLVKEVGNGLSYEVVKRLSSEAGIRIFDVAGACGTSWVKVEMYRNTSDSIKKNIAQLLGDWGIPTPISIIEARLASRESTIIASGGVWDGLRAVKSLALGADMAGFAKPVLIKLLSEGYEAASKYVEEYVESLKTVMFLIGARSLGDVKKKPVVLGGSIKSYMSSRGFDTDKYLEMLKK